MEKQRIEDLYAKVSSLSDEERKEIRAAAKAAGLNIRFGGSCKSCYHDALVMLRKAAVEGENDTNKRTVKSSIKNFEYIGTDGKYVRVREDGVVRNVDGSKDGDTDILRSVMVSRPTWFSQHYRVVRDENVKVVNYEDIKGKGVQHGEE